MSTPQEFQRVSAELTQLRTRIAALCDGLEQTRENFTRTSGIPRVIDSHVRQIRELLEES